MCLVLGYFLCPVFHFQSDFIKLPILWITDRVIIHLFSGKVTALS